MSPESDGVVVVTIDRPPVNAVDRGAYRGLLSLFNDLSVDESVRAIILTGAGHRAFSAGNDVNDLRALDHDDAADYLAEVRMTFNAIYDCAAPVIAAVNGYALGTGLILASLCDSRIASRSALFGLPEINVGIVGGQGYLARLVSQGVARSMSYTGRHVSAEEGQRIGLVDVVCDADLLLPTAKALAKEIATKDSAAIRLSKQAFNRGEQLSLKASFELECELTVELRRLRSAPEHDAQIDRS